MTSVVPTDPRGTTLRPPVKTSHGKRHCRLTRNHHLLSAQLCNLSAFTLLDPMSSPKRIIVTGATGHQGGAVVRVRPLLCRVGWISDAITSVYTDSPALVPLSIHPQALAHLNSLSPTPSDYPFLIFAVTRSPTSPSAQALLSLHGVQLLKGDLNEPAQLFIDAGGDVHGVFSVQMSLDNPDKGLVGELRQGKGLADAAKQAGVKHFVYSGIDRGGLEKTDVGQ